MCRAIDAAHEVDEVKDIRDKLVIEVYSRQAQNTRQSVGLVKSGYRAEKKARQLLRAREKAHGKRKSSER